MTYERSILVGSPIDRSNDSTCYFIIRFEYYIRVGVSVTVRLGLVQHYIMIRFNPKCIYIWFIAHDKRRRGRLR